MIGLRRRDIIARLAPAIDGPLNILAGPGAPPIPELAALGVVRVSFGSGPMAASLAFLRNLAGELRAGGTYRALEQDAVHHTEMNRMLRGDS